MFFTALKTKKKKKQSVIDNQDKHNTVNVWHVQAGNTRGRGVW